MKKTKGTFSTLWAPWRKKYVCAGMKKGSRCVFCRGLSQKKDAKNHIIKRQRHCFAILNIYPYNNGHVMIVPNRHVSRFDQLKDEELLDMMRLQNEMLRILEKRMKPHGFNVGTNLGRASGAGIDDHIHIHIVPRWIGDTNFMPVIGRAKIMSESLLSVYEKLIR